MAANHRHGNIMMSQNLLDRDEIYTLHDEVGSERMTKKLVLLKYALAMVS